MNIQSGYGVLAYNTSSKIALQQQGGGVMKSSLTDPTKNADQISLSSAGMNALAKDLTASAGITNTEMRSNVKDSWLSQHAHSNPELAEAMAYNLANVPEAPLVNLTGFLNGTGPMRYTSNDAPVTKESEAYFDAIAPGILQGRINLYETEKAKGTPDAEIVDKLIGYMDGQPVRYQEMIAWSERAYGTTGSV